MFAFETKKTHDLTQEEAVICALLKHGTLTTSDIAKIRTRGLFGPKICNVGTSCSKARKKLRKYGIGLVCTSKMVKPLIGPAYQEYTYSLSFAENVS